MSCFILRCVQGLYMQPFISSASIGEVMPDENLDFSTDLIHCFADEAGRDKFGRGVFTVWEVLDARDGTPVELLVTPEYGEAAQAQRYRITVEKIT